MKTGPINFFLLLLFMQGYVNAQNDSANVEYSQEKVGSTTRLEETICEILTKREQNEKDLWKLNLLAIMLGEFNITYERRISPKWTYAVRSVSGLSKLDYNAIIDEDYDDFYFKQTLTIEMRNYYSLHRRERLGKKVNFSGNYFLISLRNNYLFERGYDTRSYDDFNNRTSELDLFLSYARPYGQYQEERLKHTLAIGYGIQRRFGKVGYFDWNIGLGCFYEYGHGKGSLSHNGDPSYYRYIPDYITPTITSHLAIGIAF